jgi:hypothetical protein
VYFFVLKTHKATYLLVPGANLTIASYKASVVNFYIAKGSLVRFENKNILLYFKKTL